jgi:Protein of unknown function (DUF3592)
VLLEVNAIRKNFEARSWPQVDAIVLSSYPERGCGKGSSYLPLVRYQYRVNDMQYTSQILAHSTFDCGSFVEMKTRTDQFIVGKTVRAYVDPQNPSSAVLIAGVVNSDSKFGIALFALMFLGCANFSRQAWHGAV